MQTSYEDFLDAAEALAAWFKSQGIKPADSVAIMAVVMTWACASLTDGNVVLEDALKRASALLPSATKFVAASGLRSKRSKH
jgi:hypothetical protein